MPKEIILLTDVKIYNRQPQTTAIIKHSNWVSIAPVNCVLAPILPPRTWAVRCTHLDLVREARCAHDRPVMRHLGLPVGEIDRGESQSQSLSQDQGDLLSSPHPKARTPIKPVLFRTYQSQISADQSGRRCSYCDLGMTMLHG